MVSGSSSDGSGTPRGDGEWLDFDELERVEAERAVESGEPKVVARPPKPERPFQDFEDVRVGMKVQVLSDGGAVLQACRSTGIDKTYDEHRLASLGQVVSIQCKDPSDYTVKCKVPELGSIWFAVFALTNVRHEELVREAEEEEERRPAGEPFATEWWSHMSGLSVAEPAGDSGGGAGAGTVSAQDERAVMMELELEADVERRLSEGAARRGTLGSTLFVREEADSDGYRKKTFVCDAMLAAVVRFNRLTVDGLRVARVGAQGLRCFVLAVSYVLCVAFPCRYTAEASAQAERLVRIFHDTRKGFLHLVEDLLAKDLSASQEAFCWKRLEAVLRDTLCCLQKLMECLLEPTQEEEEAWTSALAELAQILASGLEHRPEWLLDWGKQMQRYGKGKNLIIRTSPVTICQLLHELRAGFQAEAFQQKYQELRCDVTHGTEAHVRMVEWTFEVQRRVLVRYGFEASSRGVWNMRSETGYHADGTGEHLAGVHDGAVAKLRRDIHVCLEMDARKTFRLPVFHTVGDSHSRFGWPACVIQHWQGPLLCYNVDRVDLTKMHPPIRAGDAICLCFGEIDCRCHVHKHVSKEKTYQEVIDGIIDRYFNHLRSQARLLPPAVRIFVYNVLPPVRRANAELNTEFPYLGEDEERLNYVQYFNRRLKQECHHTDFRFFEVYDQYCDEEGFLSEEYSDGSVHVADGVWIDEVIRGLNLKPVWVSELGF